MNYTIENHPAEDVLSACALDEHCDSIEKHLEMCHICREFVEDVRAVRDDIIKIEDEEIPSGLKERILSIAKEKNKAKRISPFICEWYKRPFAYGIITVLIAILSYVLFTFFL